MSEVGCRGVVSRGRVSARAVAALLAVALVNGCGPSSPSPDEGAAAPPSSSPAATSIAPNDAPPSAPAAPSSWGPSTIGVVTYVVDGDTVDVEGLGRVRVIGIDTPERGDCGYESATAALSVMVLGRQVAAVPGERTDADRYGRKLRYLDVIDASGRPDIDAGLRLIEDGWAIARYDSLDGYPRHDRQDEYRAADADSRDLGCYPDNEP